MWFELELDKVIRCDDDKPSKASTRKHEERQAKDEKRVLVDLLREKDHRIMTLKRRLEQADRQQSSMQDTIDVSTFAMRKLRFKVMEVIRENRCNDCVDDISSPEEVVNAAIEHISLLKGERDTPLEIIDTPSMGQNSGYDIEFIDSDLRQLEVEICAREEAFVSLSPKQKRNNKVTNLRMNQLYEERDRLHALLCLALKRKSSSLSSPRNRELFTIDEGVDDLGLTGTIRPIERILLELQEKARDLEFEGGFLFTTTTRKETDKNRFLKKLETLRRDAKRMSVLFNNQMNSHDIKVDQLNNQIKELRNTNNELRKMNNNQQIESQLMNDEKAFKDEWSRKLCGNPSKKTDSEWDKTYVLDDRNYESYDKNKAYPGDEMETAVDFLNDDREKILQLKNYANGVEDENINSVLQEALSHVIRLENEKEGIWKNEADLKQRLTKMEEQYRNMEQEWEEDKKNLEEIKRTQNEKEEEIKLLRKEAEEKNLQTLGTLDCYGHVIKDMEKNVSETKQNNEKYKDELAKSKAIKIKLERQITNLKKTIDEDRKTKEKLLEQKNMIIGEMRQRTHDLRIDFDTVVKELNDFHGKVNELTNQLENTKNNKHQIETLVNEFISEGEEAVTGSQQNLDDRKEQCLQMELKTMPFEDKIKWLINCTKECNSTKQSLEKLQEKNNNLTNLLNKWENQATLFKEETQKFAKTAEIQANLCQELKEEKSRADTEITTINEELIEERNKSNETKAELELVTKELKEERQIQLENAQFMDKQVNTLQNSLETANKQATCLENEIEILHNQNKTLQNIVSSMQLSKEKVDEKIDIIREEVAALKNENVDLATQLNNKLHRTEFLEEKLEGYKNQEEIFEIKNTERENELQDLKEENISMAKKCCKADEVFKTLSSELEGISKMLVNFGMPVVHAEGSGRGKGDSLETVMEDCEEEEAENNDEDTQKVGRIKNLLEGVKKSIKDIGRVKESQASTISQQANIIRQRIREINSLKQDLKLQNNQFEKQLKLKQEDIDGFEIQLEKKDQNIKQLTVETESQSDKLKELKENNEQVTLQMEGLQNENKMLNNDVIDLRDKLQQGNNQWQVELKCSKNINEMLEAELDGLRQYLKTCVDEIQENKTKMAEKEEEIKEANSKYKSLENSVKIYKGKNISNSDTQNIINKLEKELAEARHEKIRIENEFLQFKEEHKAFVMEKERNGSLEEELLKLESRFKTVEYEKKELERLNDKLKHNLSNDLNDILQKLSDNEETFVGFESLQEEDIKTAFGRLKTAAEMFLVRKNKINELQENSRTEVSQSRPKTIGKENLEERCQRYELEIKKSREKSTSLQEEIKILKQNWMKKEKVKGLKQRMQILEETNLNIQEKMRRFENLAKLENKHQIQNTYKQEIDSVKHENETIKGKLNEALGREFSLKEKITEQERQMMKATNTMQDFKKRLESEGEKIIKRQHEHETVKKQFRDLKSIMKQKDDSLRKLTKENQRLQKDIENLTNKIKIQERTTQLSNTQQYLLGREEGRAEVADTIKQTEQLHNQLQASRDRLDKHTQDKSKLDESLAQIEKENHIKSKEQNRLINELKSEQNEMTLRLDDCKETIDNLEVAKRQFHEDIDRKNEEINVLKKDNIVLETEVEWLRTAIRAAKIQTDREKYLKTARSDN